MLGIPRKIKRMMVDLVVNNIGSRPIYNNTLMYIELKPHKNICIAD